MPALHSREKFRSSDYQILFAVIALHIGLYIAWPIIKLGVTHVHQPIGSLVFLSLPPPKERIVPESRKAEYAGKPHLAPPVLPKENKYANAAIGTPTASQSELPLPPALTSDRTPSPSINRDVRGIFNDIKKDFSYRDQVSARQPDAPMVKLRKAIAAASTVNRDGVHEETFILGDGRPVSKVTTPFGTYCILHRKPGATIGNELATVPVSCDNL